MGNIISYLRWRGDFIFRQMPFNEVDNLILSELAYLNLQDIVTDLEDGRSVLLKDAADLYRNKRRQETENPEFSRLLEEMAKSRRFCMTRLSGYEDIIDTDQEMTQFAAIRIELEDGTLAGSVFAYLEGMLAVCAGFAIPGFAAWVAAVLLYHFLKNKRSQTVDRLIDEKQETLEQILKEAYELA